MLIATLIARHDWVKMMVLSKTIGDLLRLDNFCKSKVGPPWRKMLLKKKSLKISSRLTWLSTPISLVTRSSALVAALFKYLKTLHILEKLVDNVLNEEEKECTMILKWFFRLEMSFCFQYIQEWTAMITRWLYWFN